MYSRDFTFAPPKIRKTENPRFSPAGDVLEIGPEWGGIEGHGGGDAEAETTRETENLEIWGGEPGRTLCGEGGLSGVGVVGAAGFQDSSFSESGH